MQYIKIGKIINTHGIKGELKIRSYSDFDRERYAKGNTVYVHHEGEYIPFTVHSYRVHKGYPLVVFEGYEDINAVEKYKNADVYIETSQRKKLDDGRHYVQDLIGMHVVDEVGKEIGEVLDIEETIGAQKNMRVRTKEKEVLIPYVPAFIRQVDEEKKEIQVHVVEGLL